MASGDVLHKFKMQGCEQSTAVPDWRNGHSVMSFAAADEYAVWGDVFNVGYAGGGITVEIWWSAVNTTNNAAWSVAIERIGDSVQDIDSDGFATAIDSADLPLPGTSGHITKDTVALTHGAQMDSVAVGEPFRIKVTRIIATANQDTGRWEIKHVVIKET